MTGVQTCALPISVEELFLGFYRERRDGMEPDGPERALLRFAADQVRRMNRDEDKLEWERQSAALLKFARGQEDEERNRFYWK